MCRRTVCVRGVVVKMLGIELHDRRGKLFGMLCLYVYSYRIVTSHTYRILYESTQLFLPRESACSNTILHRGR